MKYLMSKWTEISRKIKASHVYFLLDFDGTLAAIRRDPVKVRLSRDARNTLSRAVVTKGISVAVISGRAKGDIKAKVGVEGVIYVGNHGFEGDIPEVRSFLKHSSCSMSTVRDLAGKLIKSCKGLKGVIVEDKGLTASMHCRMASDADSRKARSIFNSVVGPYALRGVVKVTGGKKVLEVRPPFKWDKGRSALKLIEKKKRELGTAVLPVYVGDDVTDESAFKAIVDKGLTVLIGRGSSHAQYYLKGTPEVISFIRKTIRLKEGKGK